MIILHKTNTTSVHPFIVAQPSRGPTSIYMCSLLFFTAPKNNPTIQLDLPSPQQTPPPNPPAHIHSDVFNGVNLSSFKLWAVFLFFPEQRTMLAKVFVGERGTGTLVNYCFLIYETFNIFSPPRHILILYFIAFFGPTRTTYRHKQ